jgi:serine acetyltransferase
MGRNEKSMRERVLAGELYIADPAGSVVVRDLPAGVVAVGSPARVIRRL